MPDPVRVGPFAERTNLWVVIETPAGGRTKFKWDARRTPTARAACSRSAWRSRSLADEIESFFTTYVERQGRTVEVKRQVGPQAAVNLVKKSNRRR